MSRSRIVCSDISKLSAISSTGDPASKLLRTVSAGSRVRPFEQRNTAHLPGNDLDETAICPVNSGVFLQEIHRLSIGVLANDSNDQMCWYSRPHVTTRVGKSH